MKPSLQKLPALLRSLAASNALVILAIIVVGFLVVRKLGQPSDSTTSATPSDTTWTCSMHPQIRQPNPGLCPICNMDLIPLLASSGGGLREVSVSPEAAALLDLRVTPVRRAPATVDLRLFGRLAYDERHITAVTARMDGRLDRLFVDFTGARVRKGDHLAEIYSPALFVAQKELIEARRSFDRAGPSSPGADDIRRRLLNAAREKLRLLQLSPEQIEAIEQQAKPDPTLRIDSPQDGVVVDKLVSEGNYVKTGDSLLRLADLSSLWLKVEAYESDLTWLRYGQEVEFTVDSVPGETFHGRIAFIDPAVDPMRRVAAVRINVANPDGLLKPGAYAKVRIASRMTADGRVVDPSLAGKWISPMHPEIIKDAPGTCDICGMDLLPAESLGFVATEHPQPDPLLVPRSAVLQTGDRALVYVRLPEEPTPAFEGRQIILGPGVGNDLIVREGLSEGELVVTRGAFKLDSELQIKGKPSMMNPAAGLEERPADEAAADLLGQWPPVQRSLHRFQTAVRENSPASMRQELETIRSIVRNIRTAAMQPENLHLWQEFSNRLLTDLTLASDKIQTAPPIAAGILRRTIEESGRHLGLPYQPIETPPADPELVRQLQAALAAYLPIAEALAKDDDPGSNAAAEAFAAALATLTLPEDNPLPTLAQTLAAAPDLKARRAAFEPVSDALIALVRSHGIDQLDNLYVVHCPMAFKSAGANWLSTLPTVLNPYYGDAMLTCGNLTDTLSVKSPAAVSPPKEPAPPTMPAEHQH